MKLGKRAGLSPTTRVQFFQKFKTNVLHETQKLIRGEKDLFSTYKKNHPSTNP